MSSLALLCCMYHGTLPPYGGANGARRGGKGKVDKTLARLGVSAECLWQCGAGCQPVQPVAHGTGTSKMENSGAAGCR